MEQCKILLQTDVLSFIIWISECHSTTNLFNKVPVDQDVGVGGLDGVVLPRLHDELTVGLQVVGVVVLGPGQVLAVLLTIILLSLVVVGAGSRAPVTVLKVQQMVVVLLLASRVEYWSKFTLISLIYLMGGEVLISFLPGIVVVSTPGRWPLAWPTLGPRTWFVGIEARQGALKWFSATAGAFGEGGGASSSPKRLARLGTNSNILIVLVLTALVAWTLPGLGWSSWRHDGWWRSVGGGGMRRRMAGRGPWLQGTRWSQLRRECWL